MNSKLLTAILVTAISCNPIPDNEKKTTQMAITRQLHFELCGNTLHGPHYVYMDHIQEEVRKTMALNGRKSCDVNVIETLDPRSLNAQGQLEAESDTMPRIGVEIGGYVPGENK